LAPRTRDDYEWALSYHLLPFFKSRALSEITKREVDRYASDKAAEGKLSANTINKTLVRLAQILEDAVDYELIPANPAVGKQRRLKSTKPRRPWVAPEQLAALLETAGRNRPLIGTWPGRGSACRKRSTSSGETSTSPEAREPCVYAHQRPTPASAKSTSPPRSPRNCASTRRVRPERGLPTECF
jgi:hypothetical protein